MKRVQKVAFILVSILLCNSLNSLIMILSLGDSKLCSNTGIIIAKEAFNFLLFIILIMALKFHPYPTSDWGFRKPKPSVFFKVGIPVAILAAVSLFFYRGNLVENGAEQLRFVFTPFNLLHFLVYYPLVSFVQEATVRGIMQSCFVVILPKSSLGKFVAIILTSLMFAQSHAVYGLETTVITFFVSILLGYIYELDRSLVTVTCIHFVMGGMAFGFSDAFVPNY